jgi:hypothetical protein
MLIDLKPIDVILLGAAAALALIVPLLAAWRSRSGVHWGPALALGAGYFAYHYGMAHPAFPPVDVTDRIAWLALASMVLGFFESIWPGPGWTRWENRVLVTALVLGAMLSPVLANSDDRQADAIRLGVSAGVLLVSWANLEVLASRVSLRALAPALLAVTGGATGVLLVSGSMVCAQLAGGLTALLGLVWVTSWFKPEMSLSRGGVPVLVSVLGALLVNGQVYSSTPIGSVLLIAASPLAAWLGRVGPVRRLAAWQSALVAFVAVLVPAGAAIGLALWSSPSFTE